MAANVPGDLLIILGFGFNVLTGILFFMVAKGKIEYENLAKKTYHMFTGKLLVWIL